MIFFRLVIPVLIFLSSGSLSAELLGIGGTVTIRPSVWHQRQMTTVNCKFKARGKKK